MKHLYYIVISLLFITCNNKETALDKKTDAEFIQYIAYNSNANKGVERIDSLFKTNLSFSIHQKGLLHFNKANYLIQLEKDIAAIVDLKEALLLFEVEKNKKSIGITYNQLGNANIHINNDHKALKQITKAVEIFKDIGDKRNEEAALDALAHVAFKFKNYDRSIELLEQTILLKTELNDTLSIGAAYNNIAYVIEMKNDKKAAENYYKKAVEYNRKRDLNNSIALRNLGDFYLTIDKDEKCLSLYIEANKIEEKKGNLVIQKNIYDVLTDSINKKNIKNKALFTYYISNMQKYSIKRDSINKLIENKKNNEKIKQVENQYRLLAKEKELIQEKKNSKNNRTVLLALLGVLLFAGLFLIQRNKLKFLKTNQEKLLLEQRLLRSQMNPHFIFNALTSIQKNLLVDDRLKSSTSLSRFAKLIRQNFEFTNKELIGLDEDLDALKNYIETQQLRFDDKFDYQINIQKDMDISYIKIPPMLLQPFVENAIEHGFKSKKQKGNLTINIFEGNNLVHIEIIDDGVGFKKEENTTDREHSNSIFFTRLKLRKLNEEKSFRIQSFLDNDEGTKISFALKL